MAAAAEQKAEALVAGMAVVEMVEEELVAQTVAALRVACEVVALKAVQEKAAVVRGAGSAVAAMEAEGRDRGCLVEETVEVKVDCMEAAVLEAARAD
eukprot:5508758-Pleurochrysis_carterae.AAC.1